MIRVSASVLLQVAGKNGNFIRTRLRWESEAYRDYLRNTDIMAHKHVEASGVSSFLVQAYGLSAANIAMSEPPLAPQMLATEFSKYI